MIVIANEAEQKLLDDLNQYKNNDKNKKCFFIQASKTSISKDKLFEAFLDLLDDLPNSYMARIYLCDDKDIFILMNSFMQRQFLEFVQKLSIELNVEKLNDYTGVFETAFHWPDLENICQEKLKLINLEMMKITAQENKKQLEILAYDIIKTLDINLIKNLKSRRKNRQEQVVMVVDDEQISRMLVYNVLNKNFEMAFAKNGKESIPIYLENAPDILFLDIGLPDINGHLLLEILNQIDPSNYIIMFSGRKDKENIYKSLRLGAQGFLGKPFSRNELVYHIGQSPYIDDDIKQKIDLPVTT